MSLLAGDKTRFVQGGLWTETLTDLHPGAYWYGLRITTPDDPNATFSYALYMGNFCAAKGESPSGLDTPLPMRFPAEEASAVGLRIEITPLNYNGCYQMRLLFDEM